MNTPESDIVITQTKKWIKDVVVGCNFCPFAAKEFNRGSIHYKVLYQATTKSVLEALALAFHQLDSNEAIETTLLIMPDSFGLFDDYLQLVDMAETLLANENYEGIYQVASFHPAYLFEGSNDADPSNYTNRSPHPMLHLLREDSVSKAVDNFPDIDEVPNRNIAFTKAKGLLFMQQLFSQNAKS